MSAPVSSLLQDARLGLVTGEAIHPRRGIEAAAKAQFPLPAKGHCHEWHLLEPPGAGKRWHAPLAILTALALRPTEGTPRQEGRVLWIGRKCWPTFQYLCRPEEPVHATLRRFVFLDPLSDQERFWAIAEALRCPAVHCVVADGSGLTATLSRRLQLAAESAGVLGLLARPWWELEDPSCAATRWRVWPKTATQTAEKELWRQRREDSYAREAKEGPGKTAYGRGWGVELQSCRGQQVGQDAPRRWIVEWPYQVTRGARPVHFSADVGCGSAPAEVSAPGERLRTG